MINEVFSVPMSVGGLSQCEAQLAEALEQPYKRLPTMSGPSKPLIRRNRLARATGSKLRGYCAVPRRVFMVHASATGGGSKAAGDICRDLHCDR
jgi:hypothetical protein